MKYFSPFLYSLFPEAVEFLRINASHKKKSENLFPDFLCETWYNRISQQKQSFSITSKNYNENKNCLGEVSIQE